MSYWCDIDSELYLEQFIMIYNIMLDGDSISTLKHDNESSNAFEIR